MRSLATVIGMLLLMSGAALGDAAQDASLVGPVPLSQVSDTAERVATARVADADGKVIGAVHKVEMRDGKPVRVEVALLGSENIVSLDASTLRYDMARNLISGAGLLKSRPQA